MNSICIVCGADNIAWLETPIDQKTLKSIEFGSVYKCTKCAHGMVNPLPTPEKISAFYDLDNYYTQGNSHFCEVPPSFLDKVLTRLAWLFDKGVDFDGRLYSNKIAANSVVCEIGCGDAKNLMAFKENGHKTVGIDPDPKAADIAKINGIEVLIGTAENLNDYFDENSVDVIIMSHSLEHCINPILAISNVARTLKPNGLFICEVPNAECTHFLWNNICSEMFDVPRHLHFFNTQSLITSITNFNLKVETVDYCGFTRHHSQDWRKIELDIYKNIKPHKKAQLPKKHTFFRSLCLWLVTFMTSANKKYDSLRVTARKALD